MYRCTNNSVKKSLISPRPIEQLCVVLLLGVLVGVGWASEVTFQVAEAPDGHAVLRHDLAGTYFVPTALKEKYDSLLIDVRNLEAEIAAGRIGETEARRRIEKLRQELQETTKQLDAKQVHVSAAVLQKKSESEQFRLGRDSCLFIDAQKVRIVGWDQPKVKCVIEKMVLSPNDSPADEEFEAIRLVHRSVPVGEVVSKLDTKEPRRSEEVVDEKLLLKRVAFEQLWGKTIDAIRIEGLTHKEGNRQIQLKVDSKGGTTNFRSQWRRHIRLTVYVPASCRIVAVRGAMEGLDVESLDASLELMGQGSRDYEATYRIRNVSGSVIATGVPIDTLENVKGDVSVVLTAYVEDSSDSHREGTRTKQFAYPRDNVYRNIGGDFRAWFCRANLKLENLTGRIDVRNDFGDTKLVVKSKLVPKAHRIVSQAGHIEVQLPKEALSDLPLSTMSECGRIRIPQSFDMLDSLQFTTTGWEGVRRSWGGFVSKSRPETGYIYMMRVSLVLHGKARKPGLDLISRAGSVKITDLEVESR
jgi:hypothetical protein